MQAEFTLSAGVKINQKGFSEMVLNEFHSLSGTESAKMLGTDVVKGLSSREAQKRLNADGKNVITHKKAHGIIYKFFSQFKDFMIIILLISAGVSFIVSKMHGETDFADTIIILSIVLLNGIIGTIQEFKAEKAIDALKKMTSPTGTVIRNGRKMTVDSSEIVQGDLIIFKVGDVCPADVRLIETVELSAEESSLTGESVPSEKDEDAVLPVNAVVAERKNMVFSGSGIATGHGIGIVTGTGMNTEIGKIASMLSLEESPETPLQKKLDHTGKLLGISVVIICIVIFVLGIVRNAEPSEMLMISISLAVAAIPEGLTAVVTIVLSLGVKRMAKKRAIVRKLPAVETLGSTAVICSDKTGTLTENKMTVTKVASTGGFLDETSEERRFILLLASLCNNAECSGNTVTGAPTEAAIMKAYIKENRPVFDQFPRIGEIPFSSKRKLMSTVHRSGSGYITITKGNPMILLERCANVMVGGEVRPMTEIMRSKIFSVNKGMAEAALRVLGVAKCERDDIEGMSDEALESGLTFCGLIGIEDPPRKEAALSVRQCKEAGIIPVMITGDQQATALEVAKRLGIWEKGSLVMSGRELKGIRTDELSKNVERYRVFAGVSPEDKVKIVRAFQNKGQIIAMTGDGINDAPALKAADIGCAMGKNGTEVAKNAADMVLTDDNFATIVSAVREGRNIFVNIRKTIHFLISCNMGEILVVFIAFMMGMPAPLLPTQLLWVNLVTDSFPALALGAGAGDDDIMSKEFLNENKDVFSPKMWGSIIIEGAFIGALALLAFTIGRTQFDTNPYEPVVGRTMGFAVLCLSQIVHSFNVSSDKSVFSKSRAKSKNKWLRRSAVLCTLMMVLVVVIPELCVAFRTTPLSIWQWIIVLLLALCPLIVSEIEKICSHIFSKSKKHSIMNPRQKRNRDTA